ncbi:hypothetical protein Dsin_029087 [Dipteronia sinensis]|uniref:RRM domain-containing protein n=1 Tax=Dipteronia sinensis TaxID=43782 RepID=A0AAD9ZTA0_9ROSI|nr:hypothetical protein Dsin_029087 [Dipteronia sinensis]
MSIPPGSSSSAAQFTYTATASSSSMATNSYFPLPFHLQQPDPTTASQYPQPYSRSSAADRLRGAGRPLPFIPPPYTLSPSTTRDAQTITPEALESVKAALASSEIEHKAETKKKAIPRKAAGQAWEDPTLADWPENDYRLFCGDLGNEVNDDVLSKAFQRFPTFNMAKVVRDKRTGKTKGYGFVSFANPSDLAAAVKEMNGKYVGNRPIKLRKSKWKERTDVDALVRQKVIWLQLLCGFPSRFLVYSIHSPVFVIFGRIIIKRNQSFQRRISCTSDR